MENREKNAKRVRPVNGACQGAKPKADLAQRETPSRSETEIQQSQKSAEGRKGSDELKEERGRQTKEGDEESEDQASRPSAQHREKRKALEWKIIIIINR